MPRPRPTYANVAATVALLLALGGTAWAAALPRNSVGPRQLKRSAVTNTKLATNAVSTAKIRLGAVTTGRIAPHAVDSSRIEDDSISARKIADGSIGAEDLAPAALDTAAPIAYRFANSGIQSVTSAFGQTFATFHLAQPGTYLATLELRVFPNAALPGHNLNCSLNGVDGAPPSVTNVFIPTTNPAGVTILGLTGTISVTAPTDAVLTCRQILGGGEISMSYRFTALRVSLQP